ncbi:MAG: phosphoribosyl-ATP pyrophosphohydrolase [Candidatus Tokpelaia sp. JSC161]|jgi:phosphoribosyl-ATP pyrophosphohydrolase|nr:MAG: phosphoribosyl-ATP pyrophosphohydrolase [Candidatus Tokpelaia sp. JSC161]
MSHLFLQKLEKIISARARATDNTSYTARLIKKGASYTAQKLGEEAFETVIASLKEDKVQLINESADLIYHLMVLWRMRDINLEDVLNELEKRTYQSGIQEKAKRIND